MYTQQQITNMQTSFLYQQINLLIELICFRLKRIGFTHRTQLLFLLNNLFTTPNQAAALASSLSSSGGAGMLNQQQQQQLLQQQQQQQRNDQFTKHPQIYIKYLEN